MSRCLSTGVCMLGVRGQHVTGEVGTAAALAHRRGPHPDSRVPGAASLGGDAPLLHSGGFLPNPPLGN